MSLPRLSVSNPVLANLIMIVAIAFGTYAWIVLPRELMPEVSLQAAVVTTIYPGASPEEVEKLVTVPIEDAIEEDVAKIDLLMSDSSEGRSIITLQFEEISDREFAKQMQRLRDAVERVNDLPAEILDDPKVLEVDVSEGFPMLTVVVGGALPERELRTIAEDLRDDFLELPNIASVRIAGLREREIHVQLDPERLTAYGLSVGEVVETLRQENLSVPAGTIAIGPTEYVVRTIGEYTSLRDIEETIVRSRGTGASLRIKHVAKVLDAFEEPRTLARINGAPSISLSIQKRREGNTIKLVALIREHVESTRPKLPDGAQLAVVNDYSVILRERLGILQSNALFGLGLVVILLYVFLGWRNAFFAALGIPVAFMTTFFFMHLTDNSLSGVALFGLILVVGVVVDDAIVVIENAYRHMQMGKSPRQAAIDGAEEVGRPVFVASLTTIAAFGPLLFMSGLPGQFMRIVPTVVILVLIASLIEVFLILPSHIAEWGRPEGPTRRRNRWFDSVRRRYVRVLKHIIRRRYVTSLIVFLIGGATCVSAYIFLDKELFPGEDFPQFYVKAEMPPAFSLNETSTVLARLEQATMTLPRDEVVAVVTNIGLLTPMATMESATVRTNVGELIIELVPKNQRTRSVDEVMDELRGKLAPIAGVQKLTLLKMQGGPPQGQDVSVKVKGESFEQLRELAGRLVEALRGMEGVNEPKDDYTIGKDEYQIRLNPEKAHELGLTVFQVAHTVRTALEGTRATTFREWDESIDVIVKLDSTRIASRRELEALNIATPTGRLVELRAVADVVPARGLAVVHRFEGERAVTVSAAVDSYVTSAFEVNQALMREFEDLESLYPGYRLDFRGIFDDIVESFAELFKLFAIALVLNFVILGAQFKSFVQPVVILCAVPFGVMGAMLGLIAIQATLSMVAIFGIVALSGIVVNDSIVLIEFINRHRARGHGKWSAILRGSSIRLRPILLTSITTVFGLVPMATGLAGKSPIWMPLATTIIFGLTASTFLTLFMMPALYAILTDVTDRFHRSQS